MKAIQAKELKQILSGASHNDLVAICLRLARFKKENKELLTYLLFESADEQMYIDSIKKDVDLMFDEINNKTPYLQRKSVKKIQTFVKRYIRYSPQKETELALLMHFCFKAAEIQPSIKHNPKLWNIFKTQLAAVEKKINFLHEDLQFDYSEELTELREKLRM